MPMGTADDESADNPQRVCGGRAQFSTHNIGLSGHAQLRSRRLEMLVDMLKLIRSHGIEAKLPLAVTDRERKTFTSGMQGERAGDSRTSGNHGFFAAIRSTLTSLASPGLPFAFFPHSHIAFDIAHEARGISRPGLPVVANDHPEQRRG